MSKIIPFEKSFASSKFLKNWNNEKNIDNNGNKINPINIYISTSSKYFFNCEDCTIDIFTSPNQLTKRKANKFLCKSCCSKIDYDKRKLLYQNSFASHEKSKYWSDKNELKPNEVSKCSGNKYFFNCDDCNHEFESSLNNINKNKWCPYCCTPSRKLCNDNECKLCFEKSFASHEKSKFWSYKNELKSRQVFKSSSSKFIFDCYICNHNFAMSLNDISSKQKSWCPYCVNQKLCNDNECKLCFDKSFASHEKSKFWSDKNELKSRKVFKSSGQKIIFDCNICNHEFISSIGHITEKENPTWCPYCVNQKLCNDNECKLCFEKSFASHKKSKFWSDKNELKSRKVFKSSHKKYLFNSDCGHNFSSSLSDITTGTWCPYCINKTEQKLYEKLLLIYPELIQQYKVEWCKNITYLPFDFCIEEYKIIIELDGKQHFEQVSNWKPPEKNQERDKYKMICANDNNFSIIRILQEDVFYDTFDWVDEIKQSIQKIIDDKIIQNIFICKNNEYDIFNNLTI